MLQRALGGEFSLFSATGRSAAISESKALSTSEKVNFRCVVDRDFDHEILRLQQEGFPVHPYENADLEAMLAVSRVAIDLINELGSSEKIAAHGGAEAVIARLREEVRPVSLLRRANVENQWGIVFDEVDLTSKIDKRTVTLKTQSYCAALDGTSDFSPGQKTLLKFASGEISVSSEPSCPRGSIPYFRGRDFLSFLSVALTSYCGTRRSQTVGWESLESQLRLAGDSFFRASTWLEELSQSLGASPS
ncbi:hypothetical protein ACFXPV_38990 [Streptomyces sp. NPDC059118]|uniref:hypothetical protein n=1 Tax=unclassified Streptomyces TaxID=2593676 RepID=UPI0036BC45CA